MRQSCASSDARQWICADGRALRRTWSVGWTCFQARVWEPHVERALNRLLGRGDVGYDIGANLGYFSAVMARAVAPTGVVVSLEPVAETFARLVLCRELNAMPHMRL